VSLSPVKFELDTAGPLPRQVTQFLSDAAGRIDEFIEEHINNPAAGFVPSDYEMVYRGLSWLRMHPAGSELSFCEWGSGIGVIACLASMLGFESVGIEIDPRLTVAAQQLARDHRIAVQLVQGSYVPEGFHPDEDFDASHVMTLENGVSAYEDLGLDPNDFGVIFAYPWPGEDDVVTSLFDRFAARGALLMTFHGQDGLMLRRKSR
jgi:hypothetical protein